MALGCEALHFNDAAHLHGVQCLLVKRQRPAPHALRCHHELAAAGRLSRRRVRQLPQFRLRNRTASRFRIQGNM